MKKIISILCAFALAASMPAAFAASGEAAVTAADVEAAMAADALANNAEDLAVFEASGSYEKYIKKIDPEYTYPMYVLTLADDYELVFETGEWEEVIERFADIDPETASVSELIKYTDYQNEKIYMGMSLERSSWYCKLYLTGGSGETGVGNKQRFFFNASDIADVINDSGIGTPKSVKYIDMTLIALANRKAVPDWTGSAVLITTEKGEYVVTDVEYTDDAVSHYVMLTGSELLRLCKGDAEPYNERAYESMTVSAAPTYSDIEGDSSVDLLTRLGIIEGYEDGTFRGENYVTRAEAAKMIALTLEGSYAFELSKDENDESETGEEYIYEEFTDIDGHWAKKYIHYGAGMGYVIGDTREEIHFATDEFSGEETEYSYMRAVGEFRPDDTVTERELAKMLIVAADDNGETMAEAEGGWYEGYVAVAKRLGICDNASDAPATRLTAAHMIRNTLDADVSQFSWKNVESVYNWGSDVMETTYEKGAFYNYIEDSVKLKGTITATADADSSLRENEIKFVISENVKSNAGDFDAGEEVTLVVRHDDIKNYVNQDCALYAKKLCGMYTAVMAKEQ
ncbi:MAG: S-layer homology domain-containing protein [Firmicutes bacterium]|nr:S-layer homology domain-containing protein [Bacillota bacterium]